MSKCSEMREIMFRGKSKAIGSEWLYGDALIYEKSAQIWETINDRKHNSVVSLETIGQYIGSKDCKGTKIFEGDIGKYKQTDGAKLNGKPIICIGKVVYNQKTSSFAVDSKDEIGAKHYDYFPIKDFEVIGNIHDNPELLKESEDTE